MLFCVDWRGRLLGIGGEEDGAGYIGTKYKDNIKSEIAWDVHDHHSILFEGEE